MRQTIRSVTARVGVLSYLPGGGVCEATVDVPINVSDLPHQVIERALEAALPVFQGDDAVDSVDGIEVTE